MQRLASSTLRFTPEGRCAWNSKRIRLASTRSPRSSCVSCGTELGNSMTIARCPSCSAFTPPPPSEGPPTHFELFDLSRTFRIDRGELKRRFLQWQQRVHPDTVRDSTESRQAQWARDWSGRVNTAYKALDQALPRAEYLLALEGAEVQEADQADDPGLLMEVLEVREALEEAQTEEDVATIRSDNQSAIFQTIHDLETAFDAGNVPAAKRLSIKLRYYQNIEDVTREWTPGSNLHLQH